MKLVRTPNNSNFRIETEKSFKSNITLILHHIHSLHYALRILGCFPFNFSFNEFEQVRIIFQPSLLWLLYSLTILVCQFANFLFTFASFVKYDSVNFSSLAAIAWFVVPQLVFLQSIFYQASILYLRIKFSRLCMELNKVSRDLIIKTPLSVKISKVCYIFLALFLPITSYVSSCIILKETSSEFDITRCSLWVTHLFLVLNDSMYWIFVLCFQIAFFLISVTTELLMEHWMLCYSKYITNIFQNRLEEFRFLTNSNEIPETETLKKWMANFARTHVIVNEFVKNMSPLLFISVFTNPVIFCLTSFVIVRTNIDGLFSSYVAYLYPIILLLTTFIRIAKLAFIGEEVIEKVSYICFCNMNLNMHDVI